MTWLAALGLLYASRAWAQPPDPASRAQSFVDEVLTGRADTAWLEAHLSETARGPGDALIPAWLHALRPEGPLVTLLQSARGVLLTTATGDGGVRIVWDSQPRLSLRLDADGEIHALEVTSCGRCSEPERYVRDLLAALRRTGGQGPRLQLATDLDVSTWLASSPSLQSAHWPLQIDRALFADGDLRRKIMQAHIEQVEGQQVDIRYPDGASDQWTIDWARGHQVIDYGSLPPQSPLRIEGQEANRWRSLDTIQDTRLKTWAPSWQHTGDHLGLEIGTSAIAAALDPRDSTVLIVVQDLDRTLSAVFRVDPWTQSVISRFALPEIPHGYPAHIEGWKTRWPAALSPDATRLAVLTPTGLLLMDTHTGAQDHLAVSGNVTALAWVRDTLWVGTAEGRLLHDEQSLNTEGCAIFEIASYAPGGVEALDTCGSLFQIRDDKPPSVRARVCEGSPTGAAFRQDDGAWLVPCATQTGLSHTIVPALSGPAVSWRIDPEAPAVFDPESLIQAGWTQARAREDHAPLLLFAHTPGSEISLTLTADGTVTAWWPSGTSPASTGAL